jgi:hypothetical protein
MDRVLPSLLSLAMLTAVAAGGEVGRGAPATSAVSPGEPTPRRTATLAATPREADVSATAWLAAWGLSLPDHAVEEGGATPQDFLGADFPVADRFDPFSPTEDLDSSSVAYNPARSEYLVVWHAFVRDTATDIYGRRLSSTGAPIGDTFLISGAPGVQAVPHVAYEATTGNYWVTWTDFRHGAIPDVMLRRISGTGQLLASEVTVNGPVNQAFASRVACGSGRCVVAWQNAEADGDAHVLIQGYEASGATFVPILLLTDPVGIAAEPDICFNPTDQHFTVVWHRSAGTHWDVSMFRLTRDLAAAGVNPVSTAAGHQYRARIAFSSTAGRYLVVWQDGRSGTTWDAYGQLVARDGALSGTALPIYAGSFHDERPVVAAHGSASEFVVAFARDISGAQQFQIYAARVTGTGSVGAAFAIRLWYNVRWTPAVVHHTGSSEYLAVWTDLGSAIQSDIQAQRFASNGTLIGNLVNVSVGRKGQETPAAAYNAVRNEYLVVWADYRSGNDYDLYLRRVSPAGVLLGSETLFASVAFLYGVPEVAHDPNLDEYLVVWQEVTSPATGYEIYAQRLSGLGALRGAAFHVSRDTHAVNEGMPVVVFNPVAREYLVAWHAFTSGLWRVWGQRVSEAGALLGNNFTISASSQDAQAPRVVHNPARNEYVAVWLDLRNSRVDVYGQRLAASGARTGADLAISTATGNKGRVDLDYNAAAANYLVAWGDNRGASSDIYGQMLGASAQLVGPNFVISAADLSEVAPLVSWDPVSGDFLVAWWEYHATTDYDLWASTVSGAGVPAGDWTPISEALEVQRAAKLSRGGTNGVVLIVWQDFRNANYDIYARLWQAAGCRRDATTLCLNDSRFQVETNWATSQGGSGDAHVAYLTGTRMESADSGVFYFFRSDNWEQQVKVLDACGVNGKYWVFAAATTNVQYDLIVTDTKTASTVTYRNPLGNPSPAVTDTAAFDCVDLSETHTTKTLTAGATGVDKADGLTGPSVCSKGGTNFCLGSGRFHVQTSWRTAQGATGTSHVATVGSTRMESADSGIFYFFQANNWEQQVKVLDACSLSGKFWVFAAATTNVEYDLVVTDTQSGRRVTYHNPLGNPSPAITDTAAFPCQ